MNLESAVVELQSRVAFHEESIDQLNRTIVMQQYRIDRLTADVARLQALLRELAPSLTVEFHEDTPPPHY